MVSILQILQYGCRHHSEVIYKNGLTKTGFYEDYSFTTKKGLTFLSDVDIAEKNKTHKPYLKLVFKNNCIDSIIEFVNTTCDGCPLRLEAKVLFNNNVTLYNILYSHAIPQYQNYTVQRTIKVIIALEDLKHFIRYSIDEDNVPSKFFHCRILEVNYDKLDSITNTSCWINVNDTINSNEKILNFQKIPIHQIDTIFLQSGGKFGDLRNLFNKNNELTWFKFFC